jgi:ABC-type branched-subunit amino acid transport system substrate-binding protein
MMQPLPPPAGAAAGKFNFTSALTGFALGAVIAVLAAIAVIPSNSAANKGGGAQGGYVDDGSGGSAAGDTGAGTTAAGDTGGTSSSSSTTSGGGSTGGGSAGGTAKKGTSTSGGITNVAGLSCSPGKNGGSTDTGVTATSIKLGATVAEGGVAQSFLGEVRQAMEAYKNKINGQGGVCGRQLTILYKPDDWNPETGARYLQNLVQDDKVFALAVVPSSEGLNQASQAHYFETQKVPVVGSDGMIKTQYSDPYIWPVAAATTTIMHVIMKEAWDRGARHPAIVYENNYRFGVEGAFAFNGAFNKLSGGSNIPGSGGGSSCAAGPGARYCGIASGQGQYANEVGALNSACNTSPVCDFMAMLLEPKTAIDWMSTSGVRTPYSFSPVAQQGGVAGMAGAQPLFTFDFGKNCGDKCDGMKLWTGYNPPIEQYANQPAVATYTSDLATQSGSADKFNQFTEGGYVGMQLLIEALKKVGPNLTRANLKAALDSMSLATGLTQPLKWSAGKHYANPAAQSFQMNSKNGFTGWEFYKDYITDPWLGQDAG